MSDEIKKRTGIILTKGSGINLTKADKPLEQVSVGLNWGAIKKKSFFGLFSENIGVDLDGTVTMFDDDFNAVDTVYYANLKSEDGAIKHSGDDRSGDENGDDGTDNEVISIDLEKIHKKINTIYIYLNSYNHYHFGEIPFTKVRVFEGTRKRVENVLATFNLDVENGFNNKVSMIMGKLVRNEGSWKFIALGQAIPTKDINETIKYLKTERP